MSISSTFDWLVVGAYFLVLLIIVIAATRQQKTTTDYFLAGRNVGFFAIGASIFASNIGSEPIYDRAENRAATGIQDQFVISRSRVRLVVPAPRVR